MGHLCSDETRKKMSINNASNTKIVQLGIDGDFICEWGSIKLASDGLGVNYSTIRGLVQSKSKRIGRICKYRFTYLSHYQELKQILIINK